MVQGKGHPTWSGTLLSCQRKRLSHGQSLAEFGFIVKIPCYTLMGFTLLKHTAIYHHQHFTTHILLCLGSLMFPFRLWHSTHGWNYHWQHWQTSFLMLSNPLSLPVYGPKVKSSLSAFELARCLWWSCLIPLFSEQPGASPVQTVKAVLLSAALLTLGERNTDGRSETVGERFKPKLWQRSLEFSRPFPSNNQNRLCSWKHTGPGSGLASRMRRATDVALIDSV